MHESYSFRTAVMRSTTEENNAVFCSHMKFYSRKSLRQDISAHVLETQTEWYSKFMHMLIKYNLYKYNYAWFLEFIKLKIWKLDTLI